MDTKLSRVTQASYGTVINAGRRAMVEVPGIQGFLLKGFILFYGMSAVLGLLAAQGLYGLVIRPLSEHLTSFSTDGFWVLEMLVGLAKAMLWFGQFVILLSCLFVAFRVALSLMTLWSEALVERIIDYRRGRKGQDRFSLELWLRSLGQSLVSSMVSLLLSLLGILVAFIPFVGPPLALGLYAYLLGRDIREPYILVRGAAGESTQALRGGLWTWTFKLGALPVMVGLVPLVGWLVLPAIMLYLVAGVAWLAEGTEDLATQ